MGHSVTIGLLGWGMGDSGGVGKTEGLGRRERGGSQWGRVWEGLGDSARRGGTLVAPLSLRATSRPDFP